VSEKEKKEENERASERVREREREKEGGRERERERKRLEAGARIDSRVALYGEVRKLQPEDSSCLLSPSREKEREKKDQP